MILLLVRLDQTFPGLWENKAYGAAGCSRPLLFAEVMESRIHPGAAPRAVVMLTKYSVLR
jgi:hypothetical protein